MYQFLDATDAEFAELGRRARGACIRFAGQQMPSGSRPQTAAVGFEVDPATGEALLLVERGVAYSGPHEAVGAWLRDGEKRFRDFSVLRDWIRGELAAAYDSSAAGSAPSSSPSGAPRTPRPTTSPELLTDLDAVRDDLVDPTGPLYLDDEALFAELRRTIRGQDPALAHIATRVSRHLARQNPKRPASILAVGPTGVGKTRTGEALADALRTLDPAGSGYGFVRLDMSEYQERYSVSKLIGSPQGYVGYGEGSHLIDALRATPRTVVLFDEIEKAHADVWRALMNAMDAGRLTASARGEGGREIDCRSAIFFFTSNLDPSGILRAAEDRQAFAHIDRMDEICRQHLRGLSIPSELLGRIGTFAVFRPLGTTPRVEIIALAIAEIGREYGLEIAYVQASVISYIIEHAQGQDFGARPDEYLVDDVLGDALRTAAAVLPPRVAVEVCGPPFVCRPYRGGAQLV